jgi:transcriptional regulator with XRE-family HTH domain
MVPTVGATIRSLRLRGGWSQRQLARRFEPRPVPRTYISKIENGLDTPTLSTLDRLARALGVTVADLLGGRDRTREAEIRELMSDPFIGLLVPHVSRLSDSQRRTVLAELSAMVHSSRRAA